MRGVCVRRDKKDKSSMQILVLTALGVVFGDIGTSPLYAFRECFHHTYGLQLTPENILGVLSCIVWSLILVITIKYLPFVMRAHNRGEGGMLALLTLVTSSYLKSSKRRSLFLVLGIFGATLFYGDSIITPAISVLSAVEGLAVATPALEPFVLPVACGILVSLFLIQKRGTGVVGAIFGPVMIIWFLTLGLMGLQWIIRFPSVLWALNPQYAVSFFVNNQILAFYAMASVFLVVTGGEALYADMGHFGVKPIRHGWFAIVLPGLTANYFGQGALLLTNAEAVHNPFFLMVSSAFRFPLIALATMATVIASQAVISGAFSITRQALQLGFLPRLEVRHSSEREIGQVYVPFINAILLLGTIGLVLGFRSSSNLAGAYGMAVSLEMVITTILLGVCARRVWKWRLWSVALLVGVFLPIDLLFFGANCIKIFQGAWFPLIVAFLCFFLITTWIGGRARVFAQVKRDQFPLALLLESLKTSTITRVSGTAVFLGRNPDGTPRPLLHNMKHNKMLHERVVILSIIPEEIPFVNNEKKIDFEELEEGFYRILARIGYLELPDVPDILRLAEKMHDFRFYPQETTYFLGKEQLISSQKSTWHPWKKGLYRFLARNEYSASIHFGVPTNKVIEIGQHIEI